MNRFLYGRRFFDVDTDPLDSAADIVSDVADEASEIVDSTTDVVTDLVKEKLDHIADMVKLHGEGNKAGLDALSDRLANIESKFVEAAQDAAEEIAEIAEETVDTAAEVPAAAADEIEAVIETAPSPPERKRTGMIGNMKGRKSKR